MKSPSELSHKLQRQWENPSLREQRLLHTETWPIYLNITKPSATDLTKRLGTVQAHVQHWREETLGRVHWQATRFRSTLEAVELPVKWEICNPSEWIAACRSEALSKEFERLGALVEASPKAFHAFLIRKKNRLLNKPTEELVRAIQLAQQLEPHCAEGAPLRTLSLCGIDTKFFERHRQVIIDLMDIRFKGMVSELGLEPFLNARNTHHHWLVVQDLDGSLQTFEQIKVRDIELRKVELPAKQIILVENETASHLLPPMKNTMAVLGAGLNLAWLDTSWLQDKTVLYWGDIDTWGLLMLSRARKILPQLKPLLMTRETFDQHSAQAVEEKIHPGPQTPEHLDDNEAQLYQYLRARNLGRLEQEFLTKSLIEKALGVAALCKTSRQTDTTDKNLTPGKT